MPSLALCPSSMGSIAYSPPLAGLEPASSTYRLDPRFIPGALPENSAANLDPRGELEPAMPMPRAYPVSIQVELPAHAPIRVLAPFLTLRVSDEDLDGIYVVTDTFSSMYGEGESEEEAIGDYLESLFAHFLDLDEHRSMLAAGLRYELERMSRYIARAR